MLHAERHAGLVLPMNIEFQGSITASSVWRGAVRTPFRSEVGLGRVASAKSPFRHVLHAFSRKRCSIFYLHMHAGAALHDEPECNEVQDSCLVDRRRSLRCLSRRGCHCFWRSGERHNLGARNVISWLRCGAKFERKAPLQLYGRLSSSLAARWQQYNLRIVYVGAHGTTCFEGR